MALIDDELTTMVEDVIRACRNAAHVLRAAVEYVNDQALEDLFSRYADTRQRFASELEDEVSLERDGGVEPIQDALYRGWVTFRAQLGSEDDVLTECRRSEQHVMQAYGAALNRQLPGRLRRVLETQYVELRREQPRFPVAGEAA